MISSLDNQAATEHTLERCAVALEAIAAYLADKDGGDDQEPDEEEQPGESV